MPQWGGGTQTTAQTTTKPWDIAVPYMKESMRQAAGLMGKGIGSNPYPGQTYVPWSNQTNKGLGMMQQQVNQGSSLMNPTMDAFQRMIGNNGMTQGMSNSMDYLRNIAQSQDKISGAGAYQGLYQNIGQGMPGQQTLQNMLQGKGLNYAGQQTLQDVMRGKDAASYGRLANLYGNLNQQGIAGQGLLSGMMQGDQNLDTGMYNRMYNQAGNQLGNVQDVMRGIMQGRQDVNTGLYRQAYNQADQGFAGQQALQQTARGQGVKQGNPYLMKMLQAGARDIGSQVNLAAAGAGSFGSGTAQKALAQGLGQYYDTALTSQYNQDRANQLQAQGMLANLGQQQQAARLAAAQGLTGAQAQNVALHQGAGGALTSITQMQDAQRMAAAQGLTGVQAQNAALQSGAAGQLNQYRQALAAQQAGIAGQIAGIQGANTGMMQGAAGTLAQLGQARTGAQLSAGQQLAALQGQMTQGQLGALQGYTGTQGANIANQANAANAMLQMQQMAAQRGMAAASMAPQIDQWRFQPAQQQMQIGSAYDQMHQTVLSDAINRWNQQQAAPWQNLARYNAIVSGAGQLGGTSTTQTPTPNPFLSMFGGGMAGTGMASSLVNSGIMSASNPFAMMMPFMGAGMGYMGGMR